MSDAVGGQGIAATGGSGPGARRVVATGLGMVTALGRDVASTWDGLLAGRSGIGPITAFDPSGVASRIGRASCRERVLRLV